MRSCSYSESPIQNVVCCLLLQTLVDQNKHSPEKRILGELCVENGNSSSHHSLLSPLGRTVVIVMKTRRALLAHDYVEREREGKITRVEIFPNPNCETACVKYAEAELEKIFAMFCHVATSANLHNY